MQRLYIVQAWFFRGAIEEVADRINAAADFLEERFVRNRRRQRFHFFSKIVDQITLPKGGGAIWRVIAFDRACANLEAAQPTTQAD